MYIARSCFAGILQLILTVCQEYIDKDLEWCFVIFVVDCGTIFRLSEILIFASPDECCGLRTIDV